MTVSQRTQQTETLGRTVNGTPSATYIAPSRTMNGCPLTRYTQRSSLQRP